MPRIRESTLRKIIENGETNTVELKVAVPRPGEMAERLCGLANAQGGFIIIGVEDKPQQLVLDVVPETVPFLSSPKTILSDVDKRKALGMRYIQEYGSITNREYRELTGVSEQTGNRDLEALAKQGALARVGTKRGRRYKLP